MSATVTVDVLSELPKQLLDSPVSDLHLAEIARDLKNWEEMAPYLKLPEALEEEIRRTYTNYGVQKREALRAWKRREGNVATYRRLIAVLCCIQNREVVDKVKLLLKQQNYEAVLYVPCWDTFREYLKASHQYNEQWPILGRGIPNYVELTLQEAARGNREICLDRILCASSKASRNVVLIEGSPGSGKTTLTWQISHKWCEGKLFQQCSLLIPIMVSMTRQKTTCLADVIPHPTKRVRKEVAKAIEEREGRGVCFIIDSWDEVPHSASWQQSFLYRFVKGTLGYSLPYCNIIVTSRPTASCMLHSCATLVLCIAEFDSLKLEEFVEKSLDEDRVTKFLEILQEKPELHAICHLPLNITIAVYLYKDSNEELPLTRTKLYKALVNTQLSRHWQLRTPNGDAALQIDISKVMEFMPQEMVKIFKALCNLAYTGVEKGQLFFDHEAIKNVGLDPTAPNTLSLIKAQKGLSKDTKYSFLHYTIQEYLASHHMASLPLEEQRKSVEKLLDIMPLTTTLPFYAGLTKLENKGAFKELQRVLANPLEMTFVSRRLGENTADPRRLLVALMNCIYESEEHQLFKDLDIQCCHLTDGLVKISFDGLHLAPPDCVSIGCFLKWVNIPIISPTFGYCNITDAGFKSLMHQIVVKTPLDYNPPINMTLNFNPISHKGFQHIRTGLGHRYLWFHILGCFYTYQNKNPHMNIPKALTYITEGLSRSSGCLGITLGKNYITSHHMFYLLLLMRFSKSLTGLGLAGNNLRGAMWLLAPALNYTKINYLMLAYCKLTDSDLRCLGKALTSNTKLIHLIISENNFSHGAFSAFLSSIKESSVCTVVYDKHLIADQERLLKEINKRRCSIWLPPLVVQLQDSVVSRVNSRSTQWALNMMSLPGELVTGKKGVNWFD